MLKYTMVMQLTKFRLWPKLQDKQPSSLVKNIVLLRKQRQKYRGFKRHTNQNQYSSHSEANCKSINTEAFMSLLEM